MRKERMKMRCRRRRRVSDDALLWKERMRRLEATLSKYNKEDEYVLLSDDALFVSFV